MRRNPFFSYPARQPSPVQYHRYGRPSVVNIPVRDASSTPPAPSSPSPSPHPSLEAPHRHHAGAPSLHPAAAAVKIQSCFRGFAVRRRKPLQNMRAIAAVRRQLDNLHSEMQDVGFRERIKSNTKERLRFTESIMALLLRLDAIEGSLSEVRLRRKETTKKAVSLQDAVDDMLQETNGEAGTESSDHPIDLGDRTSIDIPSSLAESPAEGVASNVNAGDCGVSKPVADFDEDVNHSVKACCDTVCTNTSSANLGSFGVDSTTQATGYGVDGAEDSNRNSVDHTEATNVTDSNETSYRAKGAAKFSASAPLSHPCADKVGTAYSNECLNGTQEDGGLLDTSNSQHCTHTSLARLSDSLQAMSSDAEDESGVPEQQEHSDQALGNEQEDSRPLPLMAGNPEANLEDLCGASNTLDLDSALARSPHTLEAVKGDVEGDSVAGRMLKDESERALLDKLFEDWKHLKSLLSQLCIQQHLQNQSIAVLGNRIARLEQEGQSLTKQRKKVPKKQSRRSSSLQKAGVRSQKTKTPFAKHDECHPDADWF